jgi:protein-tyrosine phosphatase
MRARAAGHAKISVEVRSRGIQDWNVGKSAHPAMVRIAAQRGYDLSEHVAYQVTADDFTWADDVLIMDDANYRHLIETFPAHLLRQVRLLHPDGIADPWLIDNDKAYTDALDRIEQAVHVYLTSLDPGRRRDTS